MEKTEERYYEAELYRFKGELTLQSVSRQSQSQSHTQPYDRYPKRSRSLLSQGHRHCPEAAGQIAGTACSDEPGAAVAAPRQAEEAHQMLSEIYNWFTEGFDTKDLQEAKVLLDELAEGR